MYNQLPVEDEQPVEEGSANSPEKRKKKWWRVTLHWLLGIVLGIVVLLALTTALLYYPPVQKYVVNQVAKSLRESLGLNITVGDINVGFPLKLHLEDVTALNLEGDTVAVVGQLTARVGIRPILEGKSLPVTGFSLKDTSLDYHTPGDSLSLVGNIRELTVSEIKYGMKTQRIAAGQLKLSDTNIDIVALSDTLDNKPSKPSKMLITANDIQMNNVNWSFSSSHDSILVGGYVEKGRVRYGLADLHKQYYGAEALELDGYMKAVGTKLAFLPLPWDYHIKGQKAYYGGVYNIEAKVEELAFKTSDGWRVTDGHFDYVKDSTHMYATDLLLQLEQTRLEGNVLLPFDKWMPDRKGSVSTKLKGRVLMSEVQRFMGGVAGLPTGLIGVDVVAEGYMLDKLNFNLNLLSPDAIDVFAKGTAVRLMDEKKREVDALFNIKTGKNTMITVMNFLNKGKAGKAPSWRIPAGANLSGKAHITANDYTADVNLSTAEGKMYGTAKYGSRAQSFDVHMNIDRLNVQQFLPKDTIRYVSGILNAMGNGTDIYSPKTRLTLFAKVDSLNYNGSGLRDLIVLSELKNNQLFAAINSENESLMASAQADAHLKKNSLSGSFNLTVDTIIPSRLGIKTDIVYGGKFDLRSTIQSDLKQYYDFKGEIENFYVQTNKGLINPTDTYVSALTSDTNMVAGVRSGDLVLDFIAHNGLNDLSKRVNQVIKEVNTSMKDTIGTLDMRPWLKYYPNMDLKLSMQRNNLLRAYLDELRIGARSVSLDFSTRTNEGIRLEGFVKDFQRDTMKIDDVDLVLRQDSSFFYATATIHKEKFRNQLPFDIIASVTSNVHRSEVYVNWIDHQQRDFMKLGVELWNRRKGYLELGFTPDPIVLAYSPFVVEGEDYLKLPMKQLTKVEADLRLRSPNGAFIAIRDLPSTEGHLLHADIEKFQLTMLKSLNILPPIEGLVDAKLEWLQRDNKANEYDLNASIQKFMYNGREVGNIKAVAVAQQENGNTYAKADVDLEDDKVAFVEYYQSKEQPKKPRMQATIKRLPLQRINPFLPKDYAELKGTLDAAMSNYDLSQDIQKATVGEYRGQIFMSDAELFAPIANETYYLDSKPIVISNGYAIFNNYNLTANEGKLTINGSAKLQPQVFLDFIVSGQNIQLLNSVESPEAMVYGNLLADANLRIKGPARAIDLTGKLHVLGSTDVTYRSKKSELKNKNNYEGLVEFTDFSDTLFVERASVIDSLSLGGMNIDLGINIEPATQVTAILNQKGSNKVTIRGGGDFNLTMQPFSTMQLSGVYRMNGGEATMTFEPVFSRRFEVEPGSQVAWSGDIMKPDINFRAISKVPSRVTLPNEPPRVVNFYVSVIAENTLDDLKLRFVTEAPEDLAMRNRLQSMGDDEQNRQSLLLLSTGYFMGSEASNAGSAAMVNERVSALLAGQLNSLMGEALGAEINFGVSDGTTARGQGTNYTYSISKRFMNNRLNFIIGGKVVTGQASEGLQQTIIDNMSLEYQIDENGTRFFRLFHKKNFENLLDGEVTETGGGYLIRRRLGKLGDLFKFGKPKPIAPDSIPPVLLHPDSMILVPQKPSDEETIKEDHNGTK